MTITCPKCKQKRIVKADRATDLCRSCASEAPSKARPSLGLPPGDWRLDPFKRTRVWVPNGSVEPDEFDEPEPEPTNTIQPAPKKRTRFHTGSCADCGEMVDRRSIRCHACYLKARATKDPRPPVVNPRRLHDPIDELKVQMVLDGRFVKCTRPERLEVLARWSALKRTDYELVKLTGWNVPRDRKYIQSIQTKEAA